MIGHIFFGVDDSPFSGVSMNVRSRLKRAFFNERFDGYFAFSVFIRVLYRNQVKKKVNQLID